MNLVELSRMTLADILKVFISFPSSIINAVLTLLAFKQIAEYLDTASEI
jgi:hypothetical protein